MQSHIKIWTYISIIIYYTYIIWSLYVIYYIILKNMKIFIIHKIITHKAIIFDVRGLPFWSPSQSLFTIIILGIVQHNIITIYYLCRRSSARNPAGRVFLSARLSVSLSLYNNMYIYIYICYICTMAPVRRASFTPNNRFHFISA